MKDLERICYIKFSTYNEMNDLVNKTLIIELKTLIIELMGKYSNIILVNENFKIIDALKKFDNFDVLKKPEKSRGIMPGREYIEPVDEKYNFKKTSENEFIEIIEKSSYKTLENFRIDKYYFKKKSKEYLWVY